MKKLFYLIFFIPFLLPAAETDPLSFFPHKAGDTWFYRYVNSLGQMDSTVIINKIHKDSVDQEGNIYIAILSNSFKIQQNGEIYSLNDWESGLQYKLSAQENEFWWRNPQDKFPNSYYKGRMNKRYSAPTFGKTRDVLEIMICEVGDTAMKPEPDCIAGHVHTLVSGIGVVQIKNIEDGTIDRLFQGGIINGDTIGTIPIISGMNDIPASSELGSAFPNPASDLITIPFTLPKDEQVEISFYNTLGEKRPLFSEAKEAGQHKAILHISSIPSGFYICELKAGIFRRQQTISIYR